MTTARDTKPEEREAVDLGDDVLSMVHAFSDEGRKQGVRDLASRVFGLQRQLAAAEAERDEARAEVERFSKLHRWIEDKLAAAENERDALAVKVAEKDAYIRELYEEVKARR